MSDEDPRYRKSWDAYRTYSAVGLLGVPLLGAIYFVASRDPFAFAPRHDLGLLGLIAGMVACAAVAYFKVVWFRCPRCGDRFFVAGPLPRTPRELLAENCRCCGLRKGAPRG
ncbi:hypothetical protein BH09VER1_BH09VER1_49310 [soil metagenome]